MKKTVPRRFQVQHVGLRRPLLGQCATGSGARETYGGPDFPQIAPSAVASRDVELYNGARPDCTSHPVWPVHRDERLLRWPYFPCHRGSERWDR
ncbi:hypothetical protein MSMEI_4274 [Mycolicibacterium smegmatis MC2 155]|uniref:Uncharacterized protein n=1 Tax=Mycolicibacterium smegmatis (strain ATCC 700084 / mc(2)155) TaxID=246196 RepID=I7FH64_MYCS2|nr:hypothetical protein MSMEI_4274 [Mycolicibacterium smegmatis MC2 155]